MEIPKEWDIPSRHVKVLEAIEKAVQGKDFAEIRMDIEIHDPHELLEELHLSKPVKYGPPPPTKIRIQGNPCELAVVAWTPIEP